MTFLLTSFSSQVVDLRNKSITYFDSMGGNNDEACRILLQYLQQESKDKKGKDLDTAEWTLQSKKRNVSVIYLTGNSVNSTFVNTSLMMLPS